MPWDIHFQPVPADDVRGFRAFTFGFRAALKVRGFQALINRWLKTFFTPKGTDLWDPNMGTVLAAQVGGNVGSLEDAKGLAIRAVEDCNEQVRNQDVEGEYPLDESLSNAVISEMKPVGRSGLELWVIISNLAGERIQVRLTELATR